MRATMQYRFDASPISCTQFIPSRPCQGFWHEFTCFLAHANIVPVSFMLLKKEVDAKCGNAGYVEVC